MPEVIASHILILMGNCRNRRAAGRLKHAARVHREGAQGKFQFGDCLVQFRMNCAEFLIQRLQKLMSAGDVLYGLVERLFASFRFIAFWVHCKYLLTTSLSLIIPCASIPQPRSIIRLHSLPLITRGAYPF